MAQRAPTTWEERVRIVELAAAGWSVPQIAAQVGCRPATVRKWRRRGQQGPEALHSRRGRPPSGPLSGQTPREQALRAQIQAWRAAHPGWGPKTLHAELARHPAFAAGPLPSRPTLARWLRAMGLTRPYQRHTELPAASPRPLQAPHEEWQMDARGHGPVPGVGVTTLVQLNDRYSHVRLLSYPVVLGAQRATRHLKTEDYQLILRLAFCDWGLPDRLAVDHDSVFYDNDSPSPFPSRLQLWLQALGIELVFSRVRCPTDQGLTERSHQLWDEQVLRGREFAGVPALVAALRERRTFLNEHLPCRTLGEVPPLVAHPAAARPRRRYQPAWEESRLDLGRVWEYLARGRWFRRVASSQTISLGGQVYYLGRQWVPRSQVEIRADPQQRCWRVRAEDGGWEQEVTAQGLEAQTLMGELARIVTVPGYQPCLPLAEEDERLLRLGETLR